MPASIHRLLHIAQLIQLALQKAWPSVISHGRRDRCGCVAPARLARCPCCMLVSQVQVRACGVVCVANSGRRSFCNCSTIIGLLHSLVEACGAAGPKLTGTVVSIHGGLLLLLPEAAGPLFCRGSNNKIDVDREGCVRAAAVLPSDRRQALTLANKSHS